MSLLIAVIGFYVVSHLLSDLHQQLQHRAPGQHARLRADAWAEPGGPRRVPVALEHASVAFWYQRASRSPSASCSPGCSRAPTCPARAGWSPVSGCPSSCRAVDRRWAGCCSLDPRVGRAEPGDPRPWDLGSFDVYSFWGIIWVHLMSHAVSSRSCCSRRPSATWTPRWRRRAACRGDRLVDVTAGDAADHDAGAGHRLHALFVRLFESFEIECCSACRSASTCTRRRSWTCRQEPPLLGRPAPWAASRCSCSSLAAPLQRWLTTRRAYITVTGRMRPTRSTSAAGAGRCSRWWPGWPRCWCWCRSSRWSRQLHDPLRLLQPGAALDAANWQRTLGDPVFLRSLGNTFDRGRRRRARRAAALLAGGLRDRAGAPRVGPGAARHDAVGAERRPGRAGRPRAAVDVRRHADLPAALRDDLGARRRHGDGWHDAGDADPEDRLLQLAPSWKKPRACPARAGCATYSGSCCR